MRVSHVSGYEYRGWERVTSTQLTHLSGEDKGNKDEQCHKCISWIDFNVTAKD